MSRVDHQNFHPYLIIIRRRKEARLLFETSGKQAESWYKERRLKFEEFCIVRLHQVHLNSSIQVSINQKVCYKLHGSVFWTFNSCCKKRLTILANRALLKNRGRNADCSEEFRRKRNSYEILMTKKVSLIKTFIGVVSPSVEIVLRLARSE